MSCQPRTAADAGLPVGTTTATFVGMPAFPHEAKYALDDAQLRANLRHATGTIRAKRAEVVGEVDDWQQLRTRGAAVDPQHDVRVEHGEQRPEVALSRGGQESVHDLPLTGGVGVGGGATSAHPAARAAGELPRRGRCAPHDGRDLPEGHPEHVVQHEREPLRRGERLEHDEQREPDAVGQQRLLLGIHVAGGGEQRVGHADLVERLRERSPDQLAAAKRLFDDTWTASARRTFARERVEQARLLVARNTKVARTAAARRLAPDFGPRGR